MRVGGGQCDVFLTSSFLCSFTCSVSTIGVDITHIHVCNKRVKNTPRAHHGFYEACTCRAESKEGAGGEGGRWVFNSGGLHGGELKGELIVQARPQTSAE